MPTRHFSLRSNVAARTFGQQVTRPRALGSLLHALVLGVPLCASTPLSGQVTPNDSALASLLRSASTQNLLPPSLISYKANTETEVAVLLRREEGTETVVGLEQIAGTARWTRAGLFEQHITGQRSQQLGLSVSVLTWLTESWLSPVLYGNRMRMRLNQPSDSSRARRNQSNRDPRDTVAVIHPLAVDRDRYYVYSRGDTLVTLRSGERNIPIVRVHVEPRSDLRDTVAVFVGDIDLDASRGTLVRLRGYFARSGNVQRRRGFAFRLVDAIAYIEYENAEREGAYWLPTEQRIEVQVSAPLFGDGKTVLRVVTRFPEMAVNDTVLDSATMARADSLRALARRRLTYATSDSMANFGTWQYPMGDITKGLHSDDFIDLGPDRVRVTGRPRFDWAAPRPADVIHYNRIEGLYTGIGAKYALRDVAPGVVVRANAGWAWTEQTVRGRVSIERARGLATVGVRAGRSLDITNDFRNVLDSGATLGALGSEDPYDYVDRRFVGLSMNRASFGRRANMRVEYGWADDRFAPTRLAHGLFGTRPFLENRGVDEGGYQKLIGSFEWHPNVNAEAALPGYSARLYYERGDGALTYQRTEFRVMGRKFFGPFAWTVRGDVGQVTGVAIPPQQLFELGRGQDLPGYANKEFAGSRAAVLRTGLMYTSPLLRQPIRLGRRLWFPALAPGLSAGVQSGWTENPSAAAAASMLRLGGMYEDEDGVLQLARVTDGVRATASVGLRVFSGVVFVGMARPVDRKASWRFLVSMNRTL